MENIQNKGNSNTSLSLKELEECTNQQQANSLKISDCKIRRNMSFLKKRNQKKNNIKDKFKNQFFSSKNQTFTQLSQTYFENDDNDVQKYSTYQNIPLKENSPQEKKAIFMHVSSDEGSEQEEGSDLIFKIKPKNKVRIEDFYQFNEILGEGSIGLVKRATKISDQTQYAIKTVRTRDQEAINNMKKEFLNLKKLNHKNIVKMYEMYIDKTNGVIYTVMEYIQGKEIFDFIRQLGQYSENSAKTIFQQIIEAIEYMHSKQVCHRDLKPNNILCDAEGLVVKITDFNVSKFSDQYKDYHNQNPQQKGIKMWTYTGTIAFSAPEIFNEMSYDESIDVWSAGVILYTMLSGKEPFYGDYVQEIINKICSCQYEFPSDPWDNISSQAKDLIKKCLTLNPEERIKPSEILKHEWFKANQNEANALSRNILYDNYHRLVKSKELNMKKSQQTNKKFFYSQITLEKEDNIKQNFVKSVNLQQEEGQTGDPLQSLSIFAQKKESYIIEQEGSDQLYLSK